METKDSRAQRYSSSLCTCNYVCANACGHACFAIINSHCTVKEFLLVASVAEVVQLFGLHRNGHNAVWE